MIGDRPDVCTFLVKRGAKTDLLLAVALGDEDLVRKHLAVDPGSIHMRVNQDWFPMIDTAKNGGHIYQWTLGFYLSAFQVARKFGHRHIADVLAGHAGPLERMVDALWVGDLAMVDEVLTEHPDILAEAGDETLRLVSDAGRYNDTATVREMLARGFPVTARGQHGAMPLHWAAFHGNPDMLQVVLAHNPPLEATDNDFGSTAMGWALHGTFGSWPGTSTGRHAECMEVLLGIGVPCPEGAFPTGHDEVDGVLREHLFGRRRVDCRGAPNLRPYGPEPRIKSGVRIRLKHQPRAPAPEPGPRAEHPDQEIHLLIENRENTIFSV